MLSLIQSEGHSAVAESVRVVLARLRQEISRGQIAGGQFDEKSLDLALGGLAAAVERQLRQSLSYSLLPLVNATGVILHTNLGRAPLAAAALDHARSMATAYSNLEFDLLTGERGKRDVHLDRLFKKLLDDAVLAERKELARALDDDARFGARMKGEGVKRSFPDVKPGIIIGQNSASHLLT